MTVPAIKNYEMRPPAGGWGISYTLKGQIFHFSGNWRRVTMDLADLWRENGIFTSMDTVFAYTNEVWCNRDPKRCMNPAQRSKAQKTVGCSTCGKSRRRIR